MGWSGWFNIGAPSGGFAGAPATISRNKDVCNVYVRGNDNGLWQRAYWNGAWHGWERHNDGGVLASEPALGSMGPDHEHVFVRGTDGNVYQKYWTGAGGWKGWFNIGAPPGGFQGGPATISRNKDVCNVYVRGNDNGLWQRAYWNGAWHGWERHNDGGVLASKPALGSMGPNHEHVFVRGTDGNVYQKYWDGAADPSGEVSFAVNECVYGWTSRYLQTGTHVTVRIQLNPDPGISAATLNALRTTWRNGIINKWANRFECRAPNGGRQAFTFDVQWVTSNAHHQVRVQAGPARSNMGTWDTNDTGDVASHEFGHMIGNPDEYADATCPSRNPVNTGTVMDDNTETVARLYNRLATFHGAGHVVQGAAPEPGEAERMAIRMIDKLKVGARDSVLQRLRTVADGVHDLSDAEGVRVSVEVFGGAPGERYEYSLTVGADGTAVRRLVDELGSPEEPVRNASAVVDADLVTGVFAAARDAGLLEDAAPALAQEGGQILPDTLVAIITVRDGNAVRRVVLPATEPTAEGLPGAREVDVPLSTTMRLPAEPARTLSPLLSALRRVEVVL